MRERMNPAKHFRISLWANRNLTRVSAEHLIFLYLCTVIKEKQQQKFVISQQETSSACWQYTSSLSSGELDKKIKGQFMLCCSTHFNRKTCCSALLFHAAYLKSFVILRTLRTLSNVTMKIVLIALPCWYFIIRVKYGYQGETFHRSIN